MRSRFLPVAGLLLSNACIGFTPETPKTVKATSIDVERVKKMVQTSQSGPFRVDSVVYKPTALPLSAFLKRLARGDYKRILDAAHLRYARSNIDDEVLKRLVKKGYIPVLVSVVNISSQTVNARDLRFSLKDSSSLLAPIPASELPAALKDLQPQAAVADVYNVTIAVIGTVTLMTVIIASIEPDWHFGGGSGAGGTTSTWETTGGASTSRSTNRDWEMANGQYNSLSARRSDAYPGGRSKGGRDLDLDVIGAGKGPIGTTNGYFAGMDISTDNDLIAPVVRRSPIEYNGLLFHPATLAPGEGCRGLMFFKGKGVDWTSLRLEATP